MEALDALPSDLYRFARLTKEDDRAIGGLLQHSQRWRLESRYGGCSCHFRHLGAGGDMFFGPPEDWFPEESDDIESTGAVYDVLERIVTSGQKVDILSIWNGASPEAVRNLTVSLHTVPRDSFRFFENYRFILI